MRRVRQAHVGPWRIYSRKETRIWWARRTNDRVRECRSTGQFDRRAAEIAVARWNREAADPAYAAAETATLKSAIDRFLAQSERRRCSGELSEATVVIYEQKAANLLRIFGQRTFLSQITAGAVLDYIEQRMNQFRCSVHADGAPKTAPCDTKRRCGEHVTAHTVSKELSVLMQTLAIARHVGEWPHDPRAILPPQWSAEYTPRSRALTPAEWKIFIAEFPSHRRAHLTFIVATAARYSGAVRARREDIDLDRGYVFLRETKTTASQDRVPILRWTRPLLEQVLRDAPGVDMLFAPWDSMRRDMRAACERAKISPVTPTDLRRTMAQWLRDAGVPLALIAAFLRHTTTKMVERVYSREKAEITKKLLEEHFSAHAAPIGGGTTASVPPPEPKDEPESVAAATPGLAKVVSLEQARRRLRS